MYKNKINKQNITGDKMKKILIVICLFLLCGCESSTPTKEVETYLNRYQTNPEDYVNTTLIDISKYSDSQKKEYETIIKNHFQNLEYTIKEEVINANKARVKTEITVYDYSRKINDALNYKSEHVDEFMDNEYYNESKFIDYKLSKIKNDLEKIKYTLEITLTKIDGKWYVDELSKDYKEKIYGIYNYQ